VYSCPFWRETLKKLIVCFLIASALPLLAIASQERLCSGHPALYSSADVTSLFPRSVDEIDAAFQRATSEAIAALEQILSLASEERTFENTVREFDRVAARFYIPWCAITTLQMVHPDGVLRAKAEKAKIAYKEFAIDQFETNRGIYRAFKEYLASNGPREKLSGERAYFIESTLSAFRRAGLELSDANFERMRALTKEIALLGDRFSASIAQDHSTLVVTKEALAGVDEEFISTLKQERGLYTLVCDYPTRAEVLGKCSISSVRTAYYRTFQNRAFPQNLALLNELVSKRGELARLLGYESFAALDIEPEMAASPANVARFLDNIALKADKKASREWERATEELPASVTLAPDGKINPWDSLYLSNYYKQKQLKLDSDEVATYFPLEATIDGMLSIFGEFLDLQFRVVPCKNCWDPTVLMIEVRDKKSLQPLIGHLLLDLFPRANKYSHACCNSVVMPISNDGGKTYQPAVAVIIANFSKPTPSKPSLLKHLEIKTLFHEFGHAVHALLGRAEMPRKAAYYTAMDFVEAPSQLFEEWIWDAAILRRLSCHYQTKEPLPDALIQTVVASKEEEKGRLMCKEVWLARTSLSCFMPGQNKDLLQIEKENYERVITAVAHDPEGHFLCSFNHLVDYGPKYYGYLWSKELAVKFFETICTHGGLTDPTIGVRYREKVLGKGGSCPPEALVSDFLCPQD
jgi:thimet oligopeptidase